MTNSKRWLGICAGLLSVVAVAGCDRAQFPGVDEECFVTSDYLFWCGPADEGPSLAEPPQDEE